jgi:hypothetical protein
VIKLLIILTSLTIILCSYLTYLIIKNDKLFKTEIKLLKQQNKNQLLNDENDIRSRYDSLMKTRYGQLNLRNISLENLPSATNIAAIRRKDSNEQR